MQRRPLIRTGIALAATAMGIPMSLSSAAQPSTPAATGARLESLTDWPLTERLPVLFLGHGSPMNAIEDNAYRRSWQALGSELLERGPRPRLILCISAHWITRGWQLTAMEDPRTIHDFGGFPQALFDQQYPAPGSPVMAQAISAAVSQPGSGAPLGLDDLEWGLDHGTWSVLKPMFPDASIPVIQLSMDYSRPPAEHFELGRQLRALRERGVLIVGSGNIVHNLRAIRREAADNQAYDWAIEFDRVTGDHIAQGRLDALSGFQQAGAVAQMAHPTWDHYLPLLYAAGAVEEGEAPRFFNEGFQIASISMRSVVWG
ncbi:MAG: 4,5-DOPA dioxygenase extradiol [Hydrogenophaga sp.]|nr:4,5-DOPA dioxygenase extradiol [Hydrogenophaga sp.]MDO9252485.1 4,5-DOPA dioxygenase extradiol [Hydrogenophaga sp.]MDP2407951.1 4,5-DOPA dioxygenase extradiol [Hydrogenophaga sp.]MDP3887354.1 4,5-DOPA dioxygenase extradiol [Hydrogenophaga sp.]MDZ4174801.1 4,5-DOPA dioxygenase extradiol [Hydrogenophaga sp.]